MKRVSLTLALCGLCVLWVLAAARAEDKPASPAATGAQAARPTPPDAAKKAADDVELRAIVEATLAARLSKELGLNDEQTVLMVRRFSDFKKEITSLRKGRQELVKELRASLKAGAPDAQIEPNLKALIAQDGKIEGLRKNVYEKVGAGFSVSQRAKLYVFLGQFEADMRRLIQEARERNAQRPGKGPQVSPGGGPEGKGAGRPLRGLGRPADGGAAR